MKRANMMHTKSILIATALLLSGGAWAEQNWWLTPQRMLQTNLREIDADMDVDAYVREVKDFGANVALFNVGGIVANYPTELEFHYRNPFMKGDLVGEVVPKLHAEGIRVMGRFDFSKINERFAAQHPEWLYVSEKGENVNYNGQVHTCLMGGYQQDYMFKILEEAATRYPLDAVFFNMIGFKEKDYSGNKHGICQCKNCAASFRAFADLNLPKRSGDMNAMPKYNEWKNIQIEKQFRRVRELIKSIREDIAICTYTTRHVDVIRQESGRPIGRGTWFDTEISQWVLSGTRDQQLTRAAVHFYHMPMRHSGSAPYLQQRRVWQQMINGAWLDFYCIGPLSRLEDRAALGPLRDVFRFHAANEEWLLHTDSAAEVGLLYDGQGEDMQGWMQLLSENHVPFDLIGFGRSKLQRYKTIVVPNSGRINEQDVRALDQYVKNGGHLLLSGKMPDGMDCFGKTRLKKTWPQRHSMYLRIGEDDKAALAMEALKDFDVTHLRGAFHEYEPEEGVETHLKLIHDVMYGPPEKCYYHGVSEISGLLLNRYGQGTAALIPFEIGRMYREWGNQSHALVAAGTLNHFLDTEPRLKVDTSALVEIAHRKDARDAFEWVSLYNHSGHLENVYHPPVPIHDINVAVKPLRSVESIRSLSGGKELSYTSAPDGWIRLSLPELDDFDVILIQYQ
jgi:hypothetical protein